MKRFPLSCTLSLAALVIVCLAGAAPAAEVQADPKSLAKALESA